jgi:hypothetical protein
MTKVITLDLDERGLNAFYSTHRARILEKLTKTSRAEYTAAQLHKWYNDYYTDKHIARATVNVFLEALVREDLIRKRTDTALGGTYGIYWSDDDYRRFLQKLREKVLSVFEGCPV